MTGTLFDDLYSPRVEPLQQPHERLLERVAAKADRERESFTADACAFVLAYLTAHGPTPGETLTDACKASGLKPADDRAFGPVYQRLAQANQIRVCGSTTRRRGHGTSGGRVWILV